MDLLATFAEQVFAAVFAVRTGAEPGTVRPVMSDALWEPLASTAGSRSNLDPLARLGAQRPRAQLIGLHAGAWYDSALVIIHVMLGDDQLPVELPQDFRQWNEDWLFQRSAQPGGDPMMRPLACPRCGAPTKVGEEGLCRHCRVAVPYLTTGWLVTQIVSHHPIHALMREKLVQGIRADPELIARVPPAMRNMLPEDPSAAGAADRPPGISR
jgi:hypothetical protein